MSIKLSIIIPHYNSPILLTKLLYSIPNIDDIQVVVVDDRSDKFLNEYKECKKKFDKTNVEFYRNDRVGKGAGAARNKGLEKAVGDWILFADADDYFVDGFYEIVHKYFGTSYDMIFFTPISYDLHTEELSDRHQYKEICINQYLNDMSRESELKIRFTITAPCSKLIRRNLFIENKIEFEEIHVSNDAMCSTKLGVCAKTIGASREIIYCITKGTGTLETTISEENYDIRLDTWIRRVLFLRTMLSKKDYNILDFNICDRILSSRKEISSKRKYIEILWLLKKNGIPLISRKLKNPIYITRKIVEKASKIINKLI